MRRTYKNPSIKQQLLEAPPDKVLSILDNAMCKCTHASNKTKRRWTKIAAYRLGHATA